MSILLFGILILSEQNLTDMEKKKNFSSNTPKREWMSHVDEERIYREIATKEFQDFVDRIYADGLTIGKRGSAA